MIGVGIIAFCGLLILAGLPKLAKSLGTIVGVSYGFITGTLAEMDAYTMSRLLGHATAVLILHIIYIFGLIYGIKKVKSSNKETID